MKKNTVKIKATSHPRYSWFVVTTVDGKRSRKPFKHGEKEQAEAYAASEKVRIQNLSTEDAALLTGERQLQDVAWCVRRLQPHGKTLREAVEHYLAYLEANERSWPVSQLVEALVHSKEREGKSSRYLLDLRGRLKRFENSFGARPVASIQSGEISDWLADLGLSPVSRANYRRLLVLLFNEGIRRKVCKENPAKDSEKPKLIESEVGILTVQQAAALLEQCDESILSAVAIGLFAGLRTSEIERLDWEEIDLKAKHILVKAEKAKSSKRRYVEISDNLLAWLAPRQAKTGKVAPVFHRWRKLMEKARIAAEIEEWPSNALRHSYVSYHLAKHQDIATTTSQTGHRSPQMIFQHYRNLVKPEDAAKYWEIAPASVAEFARVA